MADVVEDLQATAEVPETPDYGENFEKLPEDRVNELRALIQTFNSKRDLWARMVELIRCTLRRYFWLGIQHGFWNADTQQLQIGPAGGSLKGENLNEEDLFQGDFNIYTQNGKIFISTFSQNAATTRMEPSKPNDPASIRAAEEAEKYVKVYEKYNPSKVAQQEIGRLLWTDGRVLAVTKYDEDEENLGFEEDENGEPVPRATELTRYYGVLETKVPLIEPFAKWPYCKVSQEIDKVTAQYENPDKSDEIGTSAKGLAPNDEIARMSRIATAENIAQISSDTLAHLVTEDTWWLRPSAFYELSPEKRVFWIGGKSKSADGQEQDTPGLFPRGCRLKFFGAVYCGAKAVAMGDEVRVMHALPGNGNARPSMSDAMVPLQMEFNDAVGMYSEMIHKCIPRTWINTGPEEIQAILEQAARYGEFSPFLNPTPGQALEQNFFQEAQVDVPATFPLWVDKLQGDWAQFVTGNMPALMGQSSEDQKTARGYQMMRDQALGIMALTWVPYIQFSAGIKGQAARCAAKRDIEKISAVIPDKGKSQTLDVDVAAMRGGFLSIAVTDQNFPESWTERSNTWKTLKQASLSDPELAADMNLPDNQHAFREATGLSDFVNRTDDSRDLQLQEWAQMQEDGAPIVDEQATIQRDQEKQQMAQQAIDTVAPGSQAPPLPEEPPVLSSTVPIDPDTDDHVVHALEMFRILNSPEGQKLKKANPEIWQNGKLHLLAHIDAAKAKGVLMPPPLGAPPPLLPPPPAKGGAKPPNAAPAGAPPAIPDLGGDNNALSLPPAV